MNPIIALPFAALGLGYWWTNRKQRKAKKHKRSTPSVAELPPEERGPFDGPGGQEPQQPEPEQPEPEQPEPEQPAPDQSFPGPYKPHDPYGDQGPVPVPIHADATQAQIQQWPGHELHAFVSVDCRTVFVGSDWLQKVFLPAAAELVEDPQRFHSVAAITWEIVVGPFADRLRMNPAADCLSKLPDYLFSEKTKFGTFGQYATDYERYSAVWNAFAERYPGLLNFYSTMSDALETHPKVRPVLDAQWDDEPAEG